MRWNVLRSSPKTTIERAVGLSALALAAVGPLVFNQYWTQEILIETFLFGIAAASLIFLSAYGGMGSLAPTALFGSAGGIPGYPATPGRPGGASPGLHPGWGPTVALRPPDVVAAAH